MLTWNYRITRQKAGDDDYLNDYLYEIRAFYYGDDGQLAWAEEPAHPVGGTWQELGDNLAQMGRAIGRPVYDLDAGEWLSMADLHAERMGSDG